MLLGALAACSSLPPPLLPPLREIPDKVPVVLVPGITGSKLCDRQTGKVHWGSGGNLLVPRDSGYALALPIGGEPAASRLEACGALEEVRLGPIRKPVYGPIAELLEVNGYREGSLETPRPGDTYFAFDYDWRQENSRTARRLLAQLEKLRQERREERLPVVLLCQSNGGYICRYLAKYGGATLDEAEAGEGRPPASLDIQKIVLIGTANGGALRIMREVHRGRIYVPLVGRRLQAETLFSFPSIFQDLPRYRSDLFLDDEGRPMDVDLFAAESWERYGWSVYGRRASQRLARPAAGLFGNAEARRAHLERSLETARRLHTLLERDVEGFDVGAYHLIQNVYDETPDRAALVEEEGEWSTLFTGDRALRRRPFLRARASAPGDGHATRRSQLWLSPQETERLAPEPFYVHGEHFEMILDRGTHRRLLDILHATP